MGEGYRDACAIVDNATRLALMAAPAITAVTPDALPLAQLSLPLLAGHYGLDNVDVGTPELLLRCFTQHCSEPSCLATGHIGLRRFSGVEWSRWIIFELWRSFLCRAHRDWKHKRNGQYGNLYSN